jgi:hypothetical protein
VIGVAGPQRVEAVLFAVRSVAPDVDVAGAPPEVAELVHVAHGLPTHPLLTYTVLLMFGTRACVYCVCVCMYVCMCTCVRVWVRAWVGAWVGVSPLLRPYP